MKLQAFVEWYHVPARGQVGEVVALLGQQRPEQPQAVGAVALQDAPCAEVAELFGRVSDGAVGVVGEVGADDGALVPEQEAVIGGVDHPRDVQRLGPLLRVHLRVELGLHEAGHLRHVRSHDGGELYCHR